MSVDTQEALRATVWITERYPDVAIYLDAIPVGRLPQVVAQVDEAVVRALEAVDSHEQAGTGDDSVERRKWLSRLVKALEKAMSGGELLPNEREVVGEGMNACKDALAGRLS